MTANYFVDTNILVYFRDASESDKQRIAKNWLSALCWKSRTGRLSYQVLNEYYVTVTRKRRPGLNPQEARADVRSLYAWNPIAIDRQAMETAWAIQDRYRFSWWDALIFSAAQKSGCDYLLSEDMQHEQDVNGIVVLNPFLSGIELPSE